MRKASELGGQLYEGNYIYVVKARKGQNGKER